MSTTPTSTKLWMPIYIADYLADTCRLTTEQHGAYLLLIFDYWRNGALPDDDAVLAQVCRMNADAWSNAQAVLRSFFTKADDGLLHHKRIDDEISKAQLNRSMSVTRARKAAEARWSKNAPSNASSIPQALLGQCPSPTPLKTNTKAIPEGTSFGVLEPTKAKKPKDKHSVEDVDRVYQAYPLKKAAGATRQSIGKAIDRLKARGVADPASFLVCKIAEWKGSREREQAAGRFVPNYPYPATWFNEERYDDENSAPVSPEIPTSRYVNPAAAYSGPEYSDASGSQPHHSLTEAA